MIILDIGVLRLCCSVIKFAQFSDHNSEWILSIQLMYETIRAAIAAPLVVTGRFALGMLETP